MTAKDIARQAKEYVDNALQTERGLGYTGTVGKDVYQAALKRAESAFRTLDRAASRSKTNTTV